MKVENNEMKIIKISCRVHPGIIIQKVHNRQIYHLVKKIYPWQNETKNKKIRRNVYTLIHNDIAEMLLMVTEYQINK